MTDEQKTALKWLNEVVEANARIYGESHSRTINARTIQRMLESPQTGRT